MANVPSTTTTTTEPNEWAKPYLPTIGAGADWLYKSGSGFKAAPGKALAGLNATTQGALNKTLGIAKGPNSYLDGAWNAASRMAGGAELGKVPPELKAMLDQNATRIGNQVSRTAYATGRSGSGAHADVVSSAIARENNPLILSNFRDNQARQMQAIGMLPTLNDQRYDAATREAGVGDFYQDRLQAERDKEIADFATNDMSAWNRLGTAAGLWQGLGGMGGTSTTITPKQKPTKAQSVLGGAAVGGSALGPWGALLGGAVGAFM